MFFVFETLNGGGADATPSRSATVYGKNEAAPVNTKYLYTIYAMLDQRRRRWADVV